MNDERPPIVLETPGGLSVRYRDRLLYSQRDPAALPRRLAALCDPGPGRLHLVPSPLLWYGVPELLAAMGPGSALLCVEGDPLLARLARENMPSELRADPRVAFIEATAPGAALEAAIQAARELGAFRACSLRALSGGEALHSGLYRRLAQALSTEFAGQWRNRAALMVLGHRWARNIFDNLASLPQIAPQSMPRFGGAAIVCGAGPSLEAALPLIAELREKLGVLACDTALGTLLAYGIEPDLVVCLEGQAHNLADFTCLGSRSTNLAADLSSHPASFRVVRGPKFLTLARITRSPFLARAEAALVAAGIPFYPLPPLGSVGVHAAHLARNLAAGPILASGLDFSFEPGKTHARGCPSLLAEERRLSRLRRWPSQYAASFRDRTAKLEEGGQAGAGSPCLSDPILMSYAAILAEGFPSLGSGAEPELYDLRTRGPSIGGTRIGLAQASSMLREAPGQSRAALPVATTAPSEGARDGASLRDFFAGEERRLETLRLSMRGDRPLERHEFARLLGECDYLSWGFPDQDRGRELAQDFLNRLLPHVEFWSSRLAQLSASLECPGS